MTTNKEKKWVYLFTEGDGSDKALLGHRGCRLGLTFPEVTRMQVRAIFEAACEAQGEGIEVRPEIMVPLVSTAEELEHQARLVREVAEQVTGENGMSISYLVAP